MRCFVEYVKIFIDYNTNIEDVEEIETHLSRNGYDFGIDKERNILFVNIEEVDYVETMLIDRNIEFDTKIHWN